MEDRREQILKKVDEERAEYNEEYPSPVIDDYVSELQSLVQHIFELENTIRSIKNSNCTSDKKLGEMINNKFGEKIALSLNGIQLEYLLLP